MSKYASNTAGVTGPVTDHDNHLLDTFNDKDFKYDISLLHAYIKRHPHDEEQITVIHTSLQEKWKLTPEEFGMLSIGQVIYLAPPIAGARLSFHPQTLLPIIELDLNASEAQVRRAYEHFNRFRVQFGKYATNAKPVAYPYATRAVFKGLMENKDYDEIHRELTNPDSTLYDVRVAGIFHTPGELRTYYNKHKPRRRHA